MHELRAFQRILLLKVIFILALLRHHTLHGAHLADCLAEPDHSAAARTIVQVGHPP